MYPLTKEDKEQIKSGNRKKLEEYLDKSLEMIKSKLMYERDDIRFIQGQAYQLAEMQQMLKRTKTK